MKAPNPKIESGADITAIGARKQHESKYGFDDLKVGDFFPVDPKERRKIAPAASRYGFANNKKLFVGKMTHPKTGRLIYGCMRLL